MSAREFGIRVVIAFSFLACNFPSSAFGQDQPPTVLGKSVADWLDELSSNDPAARKRAAFALGKAGPEASYTSPRLLRALADADAGVREAAVIALSEIDPIIDEEMVSAIVQRLREDETDLVRRGSAYTLGALLGRSAAKVGAALARVAAEGLQRSLREDREPGVRQTAAWALGVIAAGATLPAEATGNLVAVLCQALSDKDADVRTQSASSLGEIGRKARASAPLLVRLFQQDSDAAVRMSALAALVNVVGPENQREIPALVQALGHQDAEVVRWAAFALGNIGGSGAAPAIPVLRKVLRDDDVEGRRLASAAAANIGPDAAPAVPELRMALTDADSLIRRNAALAISRIGPKAEAAVPQLIPLLRATEPDDVRLYAAEALGRIGPAVEKAVPDLVRALTQDASHDVRQRAVWALAQVPDLKKHGLVAILEKVLQGEAPEETPIRYDTARVLALRLRGDVSNRVLDVLMQMLNDPNLRIYEGAQAEVQRSAEESQGGETHIKPQVSGDGRILAVEALGWIGPPVQRRPDIVKCLEGLRDSDDHAMKEKVAEALQKIKR